MLHHALFLGSMRASHWDETLALKFYALLEIRASERERTYLDLPSIMCCGWHVVCLYIQHVCNSSLKESTLEERCLEKYKQCLRSGWTSKLIFTLISFTFSQNSWVLMNLSTWSVWVYPLRQPYNKQCKIYTLCLIFLIFVFKFLILYVVMKSIQLRENARSFEIFCL